VGDALRAAPDTGARITTAITTTSPELGYRVMFAAAGTHQLWLRVYGIGNGNTLHAGLDGTASAQNVAVATGAWRWVKAAIPVPSAGEHTVRIWMREDGLHLDRLVVTADAAFVPSGTGPPASPRGTPGPDVTPPALTSREPASGATGVSVASSVAATFSEAMDPATVAGSSFTLAPSAGGTAVPATIVASAGNTTFTLDPSADLAPATAYTATVTTAVEDVAGNPLAGAQAWSFTTAAEPPPSGTGALLFEGGRAVVEAEDHDARVPRSARDWAEVAGPAGAVGTALHAAPDAGARITTAIPTTSPEVAYRVRFPSAGTHQLWLRVHGISNGNTLHAGLDGQATAQNLAVATGAWRWIKAAVSVPSAGEHTVHAWMREDGLHLDRLLVTADTAFVPAGTGPAATPREDLAPDTAPPAVVGRAPAPGATDVAPGANVAATFSEPMDPATLTGATLMLAPAAGGAAVAGAVTASADRTVATLDPAAPLALGTEYRATVTTGAADAAGNPLPAAVEWTFTTTPPDTTAPTLTGRVPADGATGVPPSAAVVTATFSEPMDPATLSAAAFSLAPAAGGPAVPAAIAASAGGTVFTLDPTEALAPSTAYAVTVTTGARDAAGNPLAAPAGWSFTTGPAGTSATRTEITTGEMLGAPHDRRWFYVRRDGGAWEPTYADGLPGARGKIMNFRAANATGIVLAIVGLVIGVLLILALLLFFSAILNN
jgi:hypothetical protein